MTALGANKTIAIVNQKGGVAKTTSTVNIAACLVERGYKVLILDNDPQRNATICLGINNPKRTIKEIIEDIVDGVGFDIHDSILHTAEGIDIIPSKPQYAKTDKYTAAEVGRDYYVKEILEEVKGEYDFILIDCPPTINFYVYNALIASDSVLVPSQADKLSVEGLQEIISTVSTVKKLNKGLSIEGVFFTLVNKRTNLSRAVYNQVKRLYGNSIPVFESCIPECNKVKEGQLVGETVIKFDRTCKASIAYESLVEEVIANV